MKGIERDKYIREIVNELRVIKEIPIKKLDDDTQHNLIIARNHLRAINKGPSL